MRFKKSYFELTNQIFIKNTPVLNSLFERKANKSFPIIAFFKKNINLIFTLINGN